MPSPMLAPALQFHNEGLCVIPIYERDKRPAIKILGGTWEQYHTRCSTEDEIKHWWANGYNKDWNIGISHGEVSNNYITIDIDHDSGICDDMFTAHYHLFTGRIEQSGSGEGYHIPLRVDRLPDFDPDLAGKVRGNRTWKTDRGAINLRCRACQTVTVPSVHPSGRPYRYLQNGPIVHVPNLDNLIEWLNKVAPTKAPVDRPTNPRQAIQASDKDSLIEAVKSAYPTCLSVFAYFKMADKVEMIQGGKTLYLRGNRGLKLSADGEQWYCFDDAIGGGLFEAWGYCRFGLAYDKHKDFRAILLEMAAAVGIDPAQYYHKGDEAKVTVQATGPKLWAGVYGKVWSKMRG